jgi:hypothetical protein
MFHAHKNTNKNFCFLGLRIFEKTRSHLLTCATNGGQRPSSARKCRRQPFGKLRPCAIQKLINALKLRKACGIDGIPNECLRHILKRPLVHLTYLVHHCLQMSHFSKPQNEAKVIEGPEIS